MRTIDSLVGSGPEDIGAGVLHEARAIAAERQTLNARLDREAIISAALTMLECAAYDTIDKLGLPHTAENVDTYIATYTKCVTGRTIESPSQHAVASARRELSPTVTGRAVAVRQDEAA